MFTREKLDEMLNLMIDMTEYQIDKAAKTGSYSKDLAESVCLVLSIAYTRLRNEPHN